MPGTNGMRCCSIGLNTGACGLYDAACGVKLAAPGLNAAAVALSAGLAPDAPAAAAAGVAAGAAAGEEAVAEGVKEGAAELGTNALALGLNAAAVTLSVDLGAAATAAAGAGAGPAAEPGAESDDMLQGGRGEERGEGVCLCVLLELSRASLCVASTVSGESSAAAAAALTVHARVGSGGACEWRRREQSELRCVFLWLLVLRVLRVACVARVSGQALKARHPRCVSHVHRSLRLCQPRALYSFKRI